MLCSMKLHHTSRLILIKMTFVAKLHWIMPLQRPQWQVICVGGFWDFYFLFYFFFLRCWLSQIADAPWEYWVLSSWGFWLCGVFIAQRLFYCYCFPQNDFSMNWRVLFECFSDLQWWNVTRYIKSVIVCNLNSEYFDIFKILCTSTP